MLAHGASISIAAHAAAPARPRRGSAGTAARSRSRRSSISPVSGSSFGCAVMGPASLPPKSYGPERLERHAGRARGAGRPPRARAACRRARRCSCWRRSATLAGDARIASRARSREAAEERLAGRALEREARRAHPAVAVGRAPVAQPEGVDHAVAVEPVVAAARRELRVRTVAVERPVRARAGARPRSAGRRPRLRPARGRSCRAGTDRRGRLGS